MNFPIKVLVFLVLILDLSAMKWPEASSQFDTAIQKLMFVNTSGVQSIGLGDLFKEIDDKKVFISSLKLKVKSHDGKGRIFLMHKGVKYSYPIAVATEVTEVNVPIPNRVEDLSDLSLKIKGSFYIEKAKLDYSFSDKSLKP